MGLSMIWAQAQNRVIGAAGGIPWHLPEDLARFRELTSGSHPAVVIMGRATWDSFPERFRPLPNRTNVVITRDLAWTAPGAEVVHSLADARAQFPDAWVIGGAAIYADLLPYASRVMLTEVDLAVDGDTFAPELGPEWIRTFRDPPTGWQESRNGLRYAFCEFTRPTAPEGDT